MATANQEQGRAIVEQWWNALPAEHRATVQLATFYAEHIRPNLHPSPGQAIHGHHLGWLAEALAGTQWVRNGEVVDGRVRAMAQETRLGVSLYSLYEADGQGAYGPGWKFVAQRGPRPLWWGVTRHEVKGTEKLSPRGSVDAVPGLSTWWPTSAPAPSEADWRMECFERLASHDWSTLAFVLGLQPPTGPTGPTEPPTGPTGPAQPQPSGDVREHLEHAHGALLFRASEARRLADRLLEDADRVGAALAALPPETP